MRPRRKGLAAAVPALALLAALAGPSRGAPPASDASDHRASPPGGSSRVEPSIAIDPRDPRLVVTAANDDENRGVSAYWSGDGGLTFTRRTPLPLAPGTSLESDPHLDFDAHGGAYAAYLAYGPDRRAGGLSVVRSPDAGRSWPRTANLVARNSFTGQRCAFADFPALAVDRRRDVVWVAWQELADVVAGTCGVGPHYRIKVARSTDRGRHWSAPVSLAAPTGQVTYLPTITTAPDGSVYVTHLSDALEGEALSTTCVGAGSPTHVVVDRSTDGGRRFSSAVALTGCLLGTPLGELRSLTGATWRLPSSTNTAVDPRTGRLTTVAALQDSATGVQRVLVATSTDGGRHWRPGGSVSELPGVNTEFPRLASGSDGRLSLVWLAQLPGGLTWPSHSWSLDGGATWSPPLRLSAVPNNRGGPNAQQFLGDYLGNAVDSQGRAHPVWTDPREVDLDEPGGTIYTRAVAP